MEDFDDIDNIEEEENWCAYCKEKIFPDDTYVTRRERYYHIQCYEDEFGPLGCDNLSDEDYTDDFFRFSEDPLEKDFEDQIEDNSEF